MKVWEVASALGATAEIDAGVRAYLLVLQAALDAWHDSRGYKRDALIIRPGRKYHKVLTQDGYRHQGPSAYSFIERDAGRVLYASTFRKPELKNPRGSVLDGSWLEWHGPHGAGYVAQHRPGQVAERFIPMDAADYMVVRDAIMAGNAQAAAELVARRITEAAEARKRSKCGASDTGEA